MKKRGNVLQKGFVMLLIIVLLSGCTKKEESISTELMVTADSAATNEVMFSSEVTASEEQPMARMDSNKMKTDTAEVTVEASITDVALSQTLDTVMPQGEVSGEGYTQIVENAFVEAGVEPVSTFSVDVDTAGYSNMRRYLEGGALPPVEAVRIEEMLNYFSYDYAEPMGEDPFSITVEQGVCPWQSDNGLVLVGLKGKELEIEKRENTNLVFLLDVSGSMGDSDKLPLLKEAFKLLTNQLTEGDRVSMVVYAGAAGVVLDGAYGSNQDEIIRALDQLESGGSTAGSEGILQAYYLAQKYFIDNGNNRVILATDGDFNVGLSSQEELEKLIEEERQKGVFLSVLGFGRDNTQFGIMELLADKGNGQFAYIDSQKEAEKVMVQQMTGTLYTIAKDVKIQITFNKDLVKSYRLLGYENRMLNNEDFTDDTKDAGEIGAGHRVTALYQVVYTDANTSVSPSESLATVNLRYKEPTSNVSKEVNKSLIENQTNVEPSNNFKFAAAVAEFGLLLRQSEYKGLAGYGNLVNRLDTQIKLDDPEKNEFAQLVKTANTYVRIED